MIIIHKKEAHRAVSDVFRIMLSGLVSLLGQELHAILQDCNHDEREMLIRLLKYMKELFREFNI